MSTKLPSAPWHALVRPKDDLYEVWSQATPIQTMDQRAAIARAIECAPEMVELLRTVRPYMFGVSDPLWRRIADVLAKVDGENGS